MRPWRARLAVRRSRVQWALLCVVVLVAGLSATALSSLFLLSSATERFAAREALSNASEASVRVSHLVSPSGETESVLSKSVGAATEFFGDVPFETRVHIQGGLLAIPRPDRAVAIGYLGYLDGIEDAVVIDEGRLPASADNRVEVTVPLALLEDLDLDVGDTLDVFLYGKRADAEELDIVGTYLVKQPDSEFWRNDAYGGVGYLPDAPVPFSGGRLTADGFGPLLVARDDASRFGAASIIVDYVPDFSEVGLDDVAGIIERADDAELRATIALGGDADRIQVLSRAKANLGRVLGSLAVTRSSVLVTGLLVLVLAIAALAQASRLMAERRHAEQHLMRARGASSRQLLYLALVEAVILGGVTALAGPPLARLAYRAIAEIGPMAEAGMNRDPGLTPVVWAVSGIIGATLVAVIALPLLRRGGTFVEAEQARARPGRATALQRTGLDFALVALAGLAYFQLQSYRSPVLTGGGVARVDPLLAAGPALALLAGALVSVRLIPAASRFLEGVASRGRRAVTPLAAWEVGRRSARAVSAILLLTLAVSVGSFATAFLSTWHTSQRDQAAFAHPADIEITDLPGDQLAQRAIANNEQLAARAAPVVEAEGEITASVESGRSDGDVEGRPFLLLATTNDGLLAYEQGRVAEEGGETIVDALSRTGGDEIRGMTLPGEASGVQFTLTLSSSETAIEGLSCTIRVVVLDANGTFVTLETGTFPVDGEQRTVKAVVPRAGSDSGIASPAQIVGLQTVWFVPFGANASLAVAGREAELDLELSIDDLSALEKRTDVPVPGVDAVYEITPTEIPDDLEWFGRSEGVVGPDLSPVDDQVHIAMTIPPSTILTRTVSISQGVFVFAGEVPVVANAALLKMLGLGVGDRARMQVEDVAVTVHIVGTIPLMPGGSPRSPALVANLEDLQILLMQGGARSPGVTGWWVEVPDENLGRYVSHLPDAATVTTRDQVLDSLTDDPLRVGIQAALWLVAAAAVLLAAVGFAVHTVVTVRAREVEFAQLRAVGLSRGALTRLIGAESALLAVLGTLFGLGLGLALSYLVAPLVSVGPDGRPPVPSVVVDIPWTAVGLLALEIAAVLAFVVAVVSMIVRRIDPAALLRVEA